jgi:HK97 gp10 family phage protein
MNDIDDGTVKISGLAELEKALNDFPLKLERKMLVGGVRAGANVFRTEARLRAAVAEKALIKKFSGMNVTVQPGFMRKKIASWQKRRTRYAVTFFIGILGYKDRFSKLFPFWWRFLEFGTSKMAAKPFLRPAYEAKKMEAIETMKRYLAERIEKEDLKRG